MQAREIMTEEPMCCMPTDTLQTVAQMMTDCGCGLIPVVESMDNNKLLGVITDRDIICRVVAKGMDCAAMTAQNAMTSGQLWLAKPNDSIDTVIDRMEEGQVRRIPIVDDNNSVVGIISTADIALELDDIEEVAEVFEEISEPTNIPHA